MWLYPTDTASKQIGQSFSGFEAPIISSCTALTPTDVATFYVLGHKNPSSAERHG